MGFGKLAINVLETALEVGIKENKGNVIKEVQQQAIKATENNLMHQIANVATDLQQTTRTPVNAAATSEDIIKTIKKMNQAGQPITDQEDYLFTTAAGYSKVFNTNFADTLSEFSHVANFHSARDNMPAINILNKSQAEYDEMFKRLEPYINDVALAKQSDIDIKQAKMLSKTDFTKVDLMLKNIETFSSGDSMEQSRILNVFANSQLIKRSKQRAEKFVNKQNKKQDILDTDVDTLYRKIQNPKISEKDIMSNFLKYRSLQGLSGDELKTLDAELGLILNNRSDIAKFKNFSKDQIEQLQTMKSDIKNYLANPSNNLKRPLSKSAEATSEIQMSDESFIRHATGQNTGQINYSASFKINGMIDPTEFNYPMLKIADNEVGQFLESGLSNLPKQRNALYKLLGEKHLPIRLREEFLPNALQQKQVMSQTNDDIIDILELTPTSSTISQGDNALQFNDKLTKLKLLQAYGELEPTTLANDAINPNLLNEPFMKINSAVELFKNIPGFDKRDLDFILFSLNQVSGKNGEFKIALNKVLSANPNAFDNIIARDINLQTSMMRLKMLANEYDPKATDFRQLGDTILYSNKIPAQQKQAIQKQYIDAVNGINSFIAKLNGKIKTIQALDLPENWFVKSLDNERLANDSAKSFNKVSPSSAKERELAKSQMDNDEIKEAALKARADERNEDNILYYGMRNVDETAEEDAVKESFKRFGGKSELEDNYFVNKFGNVSDTDLHFIKREMNDGDDITNLNNLETFLFGDARKPNQYDLLSQINAITNSPSADFNTKYYYLDNMLDFIKAYQREIDSYTPAPVYIQKHINILTQLDNVEKLITKNINALSQEQFALKQVNKNINDFGEATSLDMITKQGKYEPKEVKEFYKNPNYKPRGKNEPYNDNIHRDFLFKTLGKDFYHKNILTHTDNMIDNYLVGNLSKQDILQQIKDLQIKGLSRSKLKTSRFRDANGNIKVIDDMDPTIESILRKRNKQPNVKDKENIQYLEEKGFDLSPTDKQGREALQYVLDFVDAAERVKKKYGLSNSDNLLNMFQSERGKTLLQYNRVLWKDIVEKNKENARQLMKAVSPHKSNTKAIEDSYIADQYLDALHNANSLGSAGKDTFNAIMNVFNKLRNGLNPADYGAKRRELEALMIITNKSQLFSSKGQFLLMKELIEDNMRHTKIDLPDVKFSTKKLDNAKKQISAEEQLKQRQKERDWIDEWTTKHKPKQLDSAVDNKLKSNKYKSMLQEDDNQALRNLTNEDEDDFIYF